MKETLKQRVDKLIIELLYNEHDEGDLESESIHIHSIFFDWNFHPIRAAKNKFRIRELFTDLPKEAVTKAGCQANGLGTLRNGHVWGYEFDIDKLVALGICVGLLEIVSERGTWQKLPSGSPYVRIKDDLDDLPDDLPPLYEGGFFYK